MEVRANRKRARTMDTAPPRAYRKSKQYMKRKTGPAPSMRAYIKNTINRMAEKKMTISHGENIALTTASASIPGWIQLAPVISQGTSQNQRVGNQVRVTSAVIRGHLALLPYNVLLNPTPAPLLIKMWLVRYKLANPASFASTDAATGFFDTGAGVSGMQANIFDMEAFINTDSYELITSKVVKVSASAGTNQIPTTNAFSFDSGSALTPFEFEFGSKLGHCLYNDSSTSPTNKNLFLVFQPVYGTGASGAFTCAELSYATKIEYIDL